MPRNTARDCTYGHSAHGREWRGAVLRSAGAFVLSVALVLLSRDAFRQALHEFRDTEPGSLLFGALQLVIGTSAAVASVGVFKRARWAARSIGICKIAAAGLLVSQPLFEPMTSDAQWAIWFGAAVVGAAATGMGWFARWLARQAAASHISADPAHVRQPSLALLPDAQRPAEPVIQRAPYAHVTVASVERHEDPSHASGTSIRSCAPSPDGERVDSGGAAGISTLPWRSSRRFIPTIPGTSCRLDVSVK